MKSPAEVSNTSDRETWLITRTFLREKSRPRFPDAISSFSPSFKLETTLGRDRFQAGPRPNSKVLNTQKPMVAARIRTSGVAEYTRSIGIKRGKEIGRASCKERV